MPDLLGGNPKANTAGMLYSRATIKPCVRMLPISVTSPLAWENSWVQAGVVIGHTRMVPGCIFAKSAGDISAGEARLLVFARAIAGESELIVLDEATSSVDSVTEALIQKAIERIFRDKTVIAIAHRLSTIRNSDQILVMRQGEIVEHGTHDSLLVQEGDYAALLHHLEETD